MVKGDRYMASTWLQDGLQYSNSDDNPDAQMDVLSQAIADMFEQRQGRLSDPAAPNAEALAQNLSIQKQNIKRFRARPNEGYRAMGEQGMGDNYRSMGEQGGRSNMFHRGGGNAKPNTGGDDRMDKLAAIRKYLGLDAVEGEAQDAPFPVSSMLKTILGMAGKPMQPDTNERPTYYTEDATGRRIPHYDDELPSGRYYETDPPIYMRNQPPRR